MTHERLVNAVSVRDNRPVCDNRDDYEDWQWFIGNNTLTKGVDLFACIPTGSSWDLWRWSGKKEVWQHHNEVGPRVSPRVYLEGYDKVSHIREVSAKFPACAAPQPVAADDAASKRKEGRSLVNLKNVFGPIGKTPKGQFAISVDGGVAVKRKDGSFAVLQGGQLVNMETLAIDLDAFFYMPATLADIKANDVVLTASGGVGFVIAVQDGVVQVYDVNTENLGQVRPARHFLMPQAYVTKVVSLLSLAGNPAGGAGAFNPLMLLLLSKGGTGKMDIKTLLLMSMLGGGAPGAGLGNINPMMLMLMLGDNGGSDDLLPLLLLGGGLGGAAAGGGNIAQNPLLLMALLGDKGGLGDIGEILPLMLLSQGNIFGQPAQAQA